MSCKIRDKAQGPRYSSQPHGQLTSSTLELRAQLNVTNDHKKKSHHTCKILQTWPVLGILMLQLSTSENARAILKKEGCCRSFQLCKAGEVSKTVKPVTAANCLTKRQSTGETLKEGQLFHVTYTNC